MNNEKFLKIYNKQKDIKKFEDKELYEYCEISSVSFWKYKSNKVNINNIPLKTGILLAQFLQCRPSDLINMEEEE